MRNPPRSQDANPGHIPGAPKDRQSPEPKPQPRQDRSAQPRPDFSVRPFGRCGPLDPAAADEAVVRHWGLDAAAA